MLVKPTRFEIGGSESPVQKQNPNNYPGGAIRKSIDICIPTYNRAAFLERTLRSISSNKSDALRNVIISDNCSTDNTQEVINKFANELPLIVLRNTENIGASRNLIRAAMASDANYIWTFGDDDLLNAHGMSQVAAVLNSGARYCYAGRVLFSKEDSINLKDIQPYSVIGHKKFDTGRTMVHAMGTKILSVLGFFSSTVIDRKTFQSAVTQHYGPDNEFAYLRILLLAIRDTNCSVLGEPVVLCRTGNGRSFGACNSTVWFDQYIDALSFAIVCGYDNASCLAMMDDVVKAFSKAFALDKALFRRSDSVATCLQKMGVLKSSANDGWARVSALPAPLLFVLIGLPFLAKNAIDAFRNSCR